MELHGDNLLIGQRVSRVARVPRLPLISRVLDLHGCGISHE